LAGAALTQTTEVPPWLGGIGLVVGPALMLCALESSAAQGWRVAEWLTPIAYIAWSIWLMAIGVALLV